MSRSRYDELRSMYESRNQCEIFEAGIKETCGVVMRQTDYDEEKAMSKIIEHDLNITSVIKEYLGVTEKPHHDTRTTNQKVFGEFRKFLDDASIRFYQKRELEQRNIDHRNVDHRNVEQRNVEQRNAT